MVYCPDRAGTGKPVRGACAATPELPPQL